MLAWPSKPTSCEKHSNSTSSTITTELELPNRATDSKLQLPQYFRTPGNGYSAVDHAVRIRVQRYTDFWINLRARAGYPTGSEPARLKAHEHDD